MHKLQSGDAQDKLSDISEQESLMNCDGRQQHTGFS